VNKISSVSLRIGGLAIVWVVVAIVAPVIFGRAINAHSDLGLALAALAAVAGLSALAYIAFKIVEAVRAL